MRKSLFGIILIASLLVDCASSSGPIQKKSVKPETKASLTETHSQTSSQTISTTKFIFSPVAQTAPKFLLPTIMVIPAETGNEASSLNIIQTNPLAKASMEAINQYLTHKQYNVKSLEGQTQIDAIVQIQGDVFDQEADLSYIASLSLGADIYIKFASTLQKDQVLVSLSAYEASTGRLLGTQTSEVNINRGNTTRELTQSAMRKAMPGLESKMIAYWNEDAQNGVQYKIIIRLEGEFHDNQVEDIHSEVSNLLKQSFTKVKINAMTDKTMDLTVYVNPSQFQDAEEVYEFIRQGLQESYAVKKRNLTQKLIFMELR